MTSTPPAPAVTVTRRTRTEVLELTIPDLPPVESHSPGFGVETYQPTGLRIKYQDDQVLLVTILTTTGPLHMLMDRRDEWEPWVTAYVAEHTPDPREVDRAHRWARVADVVERARSKGCAVLDTDTIADLLGLDEDDHQEPDVDGITHSREPSSAARYPLLAAFPGGRVKHSARLINDGPMVTTLCHKRGTPSGDGAGLPHCRACANRPNPISQQSTR